MPGESEAELVFYESLTSLAVPAFCQAVRESLLKPPAHLWLNLEDVKVVDVAGPAALLQAVRRCQARGVRVSILPSPAIHRALLVAGILPELPLEGPGAGSPITAPGVQREKPAPTLRFLAWPVRFGR